MARLNLHEYQQDILARLQEVTANAGSTSSSRLGVEVGGQHWLINLRDISEVLPVPEISPVPLTRSWFLGMANVRGNLYGITDLAAFMGGPFTAMTAQSRILLVHERYQVNAALLIDRLVGLRTLESMQAQPDAEGGEAHGEHYQDEHGQLWQVLALDSLLTGNAFMQVAA
jgi:twitching motility protein PilI